MKLTLVRKRTIIEALKGGDGIDGATILVWNLMVCKEDLKECRQAVEDTLHQYLNGKFKLAGKDSR